MGGARGAFTFGKIGCGGLRLPGERTKTSGTDATTLNSATANDIPWTSESGQWQINDDNDWVVLVGNGSVETNAQPDNYVAAQRLPIHSDSVQTGNFAFWVGEENTKVRVNLPAPSTADLADDTAVGALMSPRHSGFPLLDTTAFAGLGADDPSLQRLNDVKQMATLSNDENVGRRYFHDLSTYGQGVLSNLQSGGLKKDLTHLFESNTAFSREFGSNWQEDFVFIPDEATISFNNGSPNWGILRSFYQLHNQVSGNDIMPIAVDDDEKKTKTFSTYQSTDEGYQTNQPVHALLSYIRLVIAVEYLSETDVNTGEIVYYPRLHLKPMVALYNPYDIPLQSTDYYVDWSFNPRVSIQIAGQNEVNFRIQEAIPPPTPTLNTRFNWKIAGNTTLQPGQTRYYALNGANYIGDSSTTATMIADWSANGSYYVDMTRDASVETASQAGSTSRLQLVESSSYGLTPSEKSALEFRVASDDPARPSIRVDVSYDPRNNPDGTQGTSLDLWMKVGGSEREHTSMYGGALFQEFDTTMCPDEVSVTYTTIDALAVPADISAIGFGLRTTSETTDAHRQLIDGNPRAVILSNWTDGFRGSRGLNALSGWGVYPESVTNLEPPIYDLNAYSGYWGNSRDVNGTGSIVLYHVPREPLVSIGQLQHANLGRYTRDPAYVVGNSYAVARIDTDKTAAEAFYVEGSPTRTHSAYDWSYVVNDQLWDDYYFSTIPQTLTAAELAEYRERERTLSNPRLSFYQPDDMTLTPDILTDESNPDTARTAAAMQMLEGPFNVNSTSVGAWKAFLASNANLSVPVYNPATGAVSSENDESDTIFFRTPISYDTGFETTGNGDAFWTSYRKLDSDELTDLAEAMVDEVKLRGPFSSVGDFVNRRLSGTPEERRRGALQAALDKSINENLSTSLVGSQSGSALAIPNYSGDTLNPEDRQGMGMPGWILQGDVLQTLGPLLTARSDTFRIRAYGDRTDPLTGKIVARAWCEAIVQRVPDYVDRGDLPQAPIYAEDGSLNVSGVNETLGRQFRLLGFRWLDQEEV